MPAPALAANALLSLDEAKRYLGMDSGDPSLDSEVIDAINEASSVAEGWCGSALRQRTFTAEQHDGPGGYDLWLDNAPVASIASITEDTVAVGSTQYVFYASRGKVRRTDGEWGTTVGAVLCTYVAGFAAYDATVESAWVSGTVYALGALVSGKAAGLYTHRVYQCLSDHTAASGDEPGVGATWATKWVQVADCSVGTIPAALKSACKGLVELILRGRETVGVKAEGEDGMRIEYDPSALPATVRQKLAPYKLIRLGV